MYKNITIRIFQKMINLIIINNLKNLSAQEAQFIMEDVGIEIPCDGEIYLGDPVKAIKIRSVM